MSDSSHHTRSEPEHEQGTKKAYAAGFILSLLCTLIPYYLVTKQTMSHTPLLVTIVGFATMQMIIQVTFFLHLGRGPKPRWNLFFFIATVGTILIVVGGSIMIINNLHYNMSAIDQTTRLISDEGIYQIDGQKTGACQGIQANHKVTIKNSLVSPLHTVASKCDTLTFINNDNTLRAIGFGTPSKPEAYAGETELIVRKGLNETITLSVSGTYQFHDHLHEETAGNFTVAP